MYHKDPNGYFRLSMQNALLGRVTPNIRAVVGRLFNQQIEIVYYFDQEISDDDEELASELGTEVIADFEDGFSIEIKTLRLDYPHAIKNDGGLLLYLRKE
ncbi:hypothetical protein [Rahnella ecdela]|uniref:Uncharacterized protein n=1 Tax=Rahnella ecdela TaxID=2816250 RepID=A0ABS6LAH5_9GAMM|nr:hypothetical protein [Rahnella ecdela]MBU9843529.1 hypothetical protein [Rahnella ecdela]